MTALPVLRTTPHRAAVHRSAAARNAAAARAVPPLSADAVAPADAGRTVEAPAPTVAARPRGEAGLAALALAAERWLDLSAEGAQAPVDRAAAVEASLAYRSQGAEPALDRPRPLVLSIRI